MGYLIRRATIEDYAGICAILATSDAIHHASEPAIFRPSTESARPRVLVEHGWPTLTGRSMWLMTSNGLSGCCS